MNLPTTNFIISVKSPLSPNESVKARNDWVASWASRWMKNKIRIAHNGVKTTIGWKTNLNQLFQVMNLLLNVYKPIKLVKECSYLWVDFYKAIARQDEFSSQKVAVSLKNW